MTEKAKLREEIRRFWSHVATGEVTAIRSLKEARKGWWLVLFVNLT